MRYYIYIERYKEWRVREKESGWRWGVMYQEEMIFLKFWVIIYLIYSIQKYLFENNKNLIYCFFCLKRKFCRFKI